MQLMSNVPGELFEFQAAEFRSPDALVQWCADLDTKWCGTTRSSSYVWDVSQIGTLRQKDPLVAAALKDAVWSWRPTDPVDGALLALTVRSNATQTWTFDQGDGSTPVMGLGPPTQKLQSGYVFPSFTLDQPLLERNFLLNTTWAIVFSNPFPLVDVVRPHRLRDASILRWRCASRMRCFSVSATDRGRGCRCDAT